MCFTPRCGISAKRPKAIEGNRRQPKATEGDRRQPKATEGNRQPRLALAAQWAPFLSFFSFSSGSSIVEEKLSRGSCISTSSSVVVVVVVLSDSP